VDGRSLERRVDSQQLAIAQAPRDDGALSGAGELAVAALLLRGVALAPALARRRMKYTAEPTEQERQAWQANTAIAKKIWDDKYAPPKQEQKPVTRTVRDPEGNYHEYEDPDEFEFLPQQGIRIRQPNNSVLSAERYRNFLRRTSQGPEVAVQIQADPATLAHEMGHAEMYARANQINGTASDLISRLQENKVDWLPSIRAMASGKTDGDWKRSLFPVAGALAGLGAGALLGDDGAAVGGLVGAATGLPLLAVEAEAWRRGSEYAKAMGVSRRRYAAQAIIPLLSYAALPLSSAALGAASADLSSDLFRGQLG